MNVLCNRCGVFFAVFEGEIEKYAVVEKEKQKNHKK